MSVCVCVCLDVRKHVALVYVTAVISCLVCIQGSYGHEKPGKVMEF